LITWITPFVAMTSGVVTFALFTKTFEPATRMRRLFPLAVFADRSLTTSAAATLPTTDVIQEHGAELRLVAKQHRQRRFGTFLNAASVGAKTVYGPG
jgi:hypothetical protein